MIRSLLRLLSMIMLAIAVIMVVLDATRSIAAEAFVMTPLGAAWATYSPATLERARELVVQNVAAIAWDPMAVALLALPGFAVFAGLSLLFALAGRRPARRAGLVLPEH